MENFDAKTVLERLKQKLEVKTDKELSEIFRVKPNTICSWKTRNTLDYKRLIAICCCHGIDLNELFHPIVKGQDYYKGKNQSLWVQYQYISEK